MTMSTLKERLRADLTTAMKARDELRTSTLRLALSAVKEAEVSGKAAHELSEAEVEKVLTREVRKRREASEAYAAAGRAEQAAREGSEGDVLADYLPKQLDDAELTAIVEKALADGAFAGPKAIGPAMKAVQAVVAGRADGSKVAALVKSHLTA
jgi:uncharacterized protein YqeY